MKLTRYILAFLLAVLAIAADAKFDPANPPEPGGVTIYAQARPSAGGNVSPGSRKAMPGEKVNFNCYANTGYSFVCWKDEDGNKISDSRSMSVMAGERDMTYYAVFRYNPSSPDEPSVPEVMAEVRAEAKPSAGGYTSGSGKYAVGSTVSLTAYANSGYRFVNWTRNGEVIGISRTVSYTVEESDNRLYANFVFDPSNPGEPSTPTAKKRLYLQSSPKGSASFNISSGTLTEVGSKVYVNVYPSTGYRFVNVTDETGNEVSSSTSFSLTMPDKETTLTANMVYDPSNPGDPGTPGITRCVIYGARTSIMPGESGIYTVSLENNVDVTGINIDLEFPEGLLFDTDAVLLGSRAEGHTLDAEKIDERTWRFRISGTSILAGANGPVLRFLMSSPADAVGGTTYDVRLSHGVLHLADGTQRVCEVADGRVMIATTAETLPDSPDFIVTGVSADEAEIMPGDAVTLHWTVENIGKEAAASGWSEMLYLISEDGRRTSLGTVYHDCAEMLPGAKVTRTATMAVSRYPSVSGRMNAAVTLIPNALSGEIEQRQGNNSAVGSGLPVTLGKRLVLEVPQTVAEGEESEVKCRLTRSGSWDVAETFTIGSQTSDSRITMPATVTIARNMSGAYFNLSVADNDELDLIKAIDIYAEGNGYDRVEEIVSIVDDELPEIGLSVSKPVVTEGESIVLTVSLPFAAGADTEVSLSVDRGARIEIPASVTVPAGESSATAECKATDNKTIDGDTRVTVVAECAGYISADADIEILDNDIPALSLEIVPSEIGEGDGPSAAVGTISRTDNIDKKVTVLIGDDSNGELILPERKLVLAAGEASREFTIGVTDNNIVDGDRVVTVNAAVYISSCSCTATGKSGGSVESTITIIDNDGPSLSLSSSKSVITEGDPEGIILKVSRNTDTSSALVVRVTSDADDLLDYPNEVTIPAGSRSTDIVVKAREGNVEENRTVTFHATAEGYSKGTFWAMISDRTLPDAKISNIIIEGEDPVPGSSVEVEVTLINTGAADLPAMTKTYVYVNDVAVASLFNQKAISPGSEDRLKTKVTMPESVGVCRVYASANVDKVVSELSLSNNSSSVVRVNVVSPYRADVSLDKETALRGETVTMTGKLSGTVEPGTKIETYFVNNGLRQTVMAEVDAEGGFSASFTPYASQAGHFSAGACYPGEKLKDEMCSFELLNLLPVSNSPVTCEVKAGMAYTGKVMFSNPSGKSLKGVKAEVSGLTGSCSLIPEISPVIGASSNAEMSFTLLCDEPTSGNDWEKAEVRIITDEGVEATLPIYYYCRIPRGSLSADLSEIETTLTVGREMTYPFVIRNSGAGETGRIRLALPDWMSSVTPIEMPSLAPGDEVTVILRLASNDKMNLNVPVTGTLGVNCDSGDGLTMRYKVTPVTDETGKVVVEACDEYTYNTAEAPRVRGAEVTVKNPSTGAVLHSMITGEDGTCMLEMKAGYYLLEVTAEKHYPYSGFFYVSPGRTETVTADISYNPITIEWDVKETGVEDEYSVEINTKYETNVPMPVVKMIMPKSIDGDNMAVGDATMINVVLVNQGLIRAQDVELQLPSEPTEWKFEALDYNEPFDLNPNQSVTVPVRITRIADESGDPSGKPARNIAETTRDTYVNCMTHLSETYKYVCGKYLKNNGSAESLAMKMCATSATMNAVGEILGYVFKYGPKIPTVPGGGGGGGSSGGSGDGTSSYGDPSVSFSICNPCDAEKGERIIDTLIGKSWMAPFWDMVNKIVQSFRKKGRPVHIVTRALGENLKDNAKNIGYNLIPHDGGDVANVAVDIVELTKPCEDESDGGPDADLDLSRRKENPQKAKSDHEWIESFENLAHIYVGQVESIAQILNWCIGDKVWYSEMDAEKTAFMEYILGLEDGSIISDEEIESHRPMTVSFEQARAYADLMLGHSPEGEPTIVEMEEQFDKFAAADAVAAENGYESCTNYFYDAYDDYKQRFEDLKNNSVCASVSLQFNQTMTMTRQAFEGTLKVFNGHDSKPMENVRLNLLIRDSNGNVATSHEFQTNPGSLEGFTGTPGLSDGWQLEAGENGKATVVFIPTRYAAPEEEMIYYFGGNITYVDPFTGLEVTRNLNPVAMTVKPSPTLDLTYFMQRDVYGDDPLTPETVEPEVPAEFALVINNKGVGEAENVRLVTQQPQITDNEKGLLIDFEILGSQFNGGEKILSLGGETATDFGNIPAGTSTYAQWWLRSSLLGHFVDYNVEATHVTSYGNPDLSLLDKVTIHELIHGFTPASGSVMSPRAFLVNDIPDPDNQPDIIYFSDASGEVEATPAAGAIMLQESDRVFTISVSPSQSGWTFGSADDLAHGRTLKSVKRNSDGREVPVDNFWQTGVTLKDGKKPEYENKIHFVAMLEGDETFTLTFEDSPKTRLEVKSFSGIGKDTPMLDDRLKSVVVTFNKPVFADTFTAEDMKLAREGTPVSLADVTVTQQSDLDYVISFGEATVGNGYYVLTVNTSGIMDTEGFSGHEGKSVSWVQYLDGMATLTVLCQPAEGGMTDPSGIRSVKIGKEVKITATASEGYDFVEWLEGEKKVSSDPEYSFIPDGDRHLTALFSLRSYPVTVLCDEEKGTVAGGGSGLYDHGSSLDLTAVPNPGYSFVRWSLDGKEMSTDQAISHKVTGPVTLNAEFIDDVLSGIGKTSDMGLSITPIPMGDKVTVGGDFVEISQLCFFDIDGRKVLEVKNVRPGDSIDVSSLARGVYMVRAVTDGNILTREVIKR